MMAETTTQDNTVEITMQDTVGNRLPQLVPAGIKPLQLPPKRLPPVTREAPVVHVALAIVGQLDQRVPMERQGEMVPMETMVTLVQMVDQPSQQRQESQLPPNVVVKVAAKVKQGLPVQEDHPDDPVQLEKMELMDRTPQVQEMVSLVRLVLMDDQVPRVQLEMMVLPQLQLCQQELPGRPVMTALLELREAPDPPESPVLMVMPEKPVQLAALAAQARTAMMAPPVQRAPAVDKETAAIVPQQDWLQDIKNIEQHDARNRQWFFTTNSGQ